jgi:hypothetical protein
VGILSTLRQDKAGDWPSLLEFLRQARHREASAVAALGNALGAPAVEQKELAESIDAGPVLLELACDLRVPRTSRLAAARCLLEAGIEEPYVGQLFLGGGDLVTDPRMGAQARKLVELGLPSAVKIPGPAESVTLEAGALARSISAAGSTVGNDRVKELVAGAPPFHAGVMAGLFAVGLGELPPTQRDAWNKLLADTCVANRRAPAAARRMGMAPQWPPNLPDAFAPMINEAEEKATGVVSRDAAANPSALKPPPPPSKSPPQKPPVGEFAQRGGKAGGAGFAGDGRSPQGAALAAPPPKIAEGKTLAPPIRRSPFRQPPSAKAEAPVNVPPKPMEEIKGRVTPSTPLPDGPKPQLEPKEDGTPRTPRAAPLAPPPKNRQDDFRFDPRGNRIPRADRWNHDDWEWQEPILPPSAMPPPMKAAVAQGPLAQRIASIFEDRPEAVERLCAAAEVQVALRGVEVLRQELLRELSSKKYVDKRPSAEQLARLRAVASSEAQPAPWRFAANLLLERLAPGDTP